MGKTNKKLFLFDEQYHIVFQKSARFTETVDEDGYPCENLESLRQSVFDSLKEVLLLEAFNIKAINFSAYGASFVFINEQGNPLTPLYNYLKPFPEKFSEQFYNSYGGQIKISHQTASPVLGSLNSGLQLYRLKQEQPAIFKQLKYALHLPQYLSFLISGKMCSDITSIGCHTLLWDFKKQQYHQWVHDERILQKLAPIAHGEAASKIEYLQHHMQVGCGLHDSSAALIPYLLNFHEPFVLISTGTWSISLNPFNTTPLTAAELMQDCLCYLSYKGIPVKAARLFAGNEHEQQLKRIAAHFNQTPLYYRQAGFDIDILQKIKINETDTFDYSILKESVFAKRNLALFSTGAEAYHQLILDIVRQQCISTGLVIKDSSIRRIFVDGGFSNNAIFMNLLALHFPGVEVYAASMAQATAAGAALAIHTAWNTKPIPGDIIELKYFSANHVSLI